MLNKFRSIDLEWDWANETFVQDMSASSSDERGRKLTVQILNKGQVEDLSGVGLSLYWETKNKEHYGLDKFDIVDAEKGIYEIYFTTGMLSNIGCLKAHLHLIDSNGDGVITSKPFNLEVFKGIDTEAIESEDSFTALTDALVQITEFESDEQERKENELQRQENEQAREQAENERESDFDSNMISWQDEFDQSQQERTNEFEDFLDNIGTLGIKDILVNVKDFGAKGDGTTDDTQAIQDTIDEALGNGGGIVFVPVGQYRIEGYVEFGNNVHFVGAGKSSVLDGANGSNNNAFIRPKSNLRGNKETYDGASDFSFKNIAVTSSDLSRQMFYFDNCNNFRLENIWGLSTADHYLDINNSRNGTFENIHVVANEGAKSLLQIDSREGKNDGMYFNKIYAINDKNVSDPDFTQVNSLFHLHREGGKNISINNVYSENFPVFLYKDDGYVFENLEITNINISGAYYPFYIRNNDSSSLNKNMVVNNMKIDVASDSYRDMGLFAHVDGLVLDKVFINGKNSSREPILARGCRNIEYGLIETKGPFAPSLTDALSYIIHENSSNYNFTSAVNGEWKPIAKQFNNSTREPNTYGNRGGYYTLVGREIFLTGRMTISNHQNMSGRIVIEGLPIKMKVDMGETQQRAVGSVAMHQSVQEYISVLGYPEGAVAHSKNHLELVRSGVNAKQLEWEDLEHSQFYIMFSVSYTIEVKEV